MSRIMLYTLSSFAVCPPENSANTARWWSRRFLLAFLPNGQLVVWSSNPVISRAYYCQMVPKPPMNQCLNWPCYLREVSSTKPQVCRWLGEDSVTESEAFQLAQVGGGGTRCCDAADDSSLGTSARGVTWLHFFQAKMIQNATRNISEG